MNSMSKYYYKDDCDPCKKEREKKEKKVCPTIIKCGCPSTFNFPVIVADSPLLGNEFQITSLTLDTSCLKDPCVKLEFASTISAVAAVDANLTFQVYKICGNQQFPTPVGPAWTFASLLDVGFSNTFSFFVCDCDCCSCFNDCCTYIVRVASNAVIGVGVGLAVNNATLGAIATCSNCC